MYCHLRRFFVTLVLRNLRIVCIVILFIVFVVAFLFVLFVVILFVIVFLLPELLLRWNKLSHGSRLSVCHLPALCSVLRQE